VQEVTTTAVGRFDVVNTLFVRVGPTTMILWAKPKNLGQWIGSYQSRQPTIHRINLPRGSLHQLQ